MNTLHSICGLNNQAVELLISGQTSKASKTFQNAAQLLSHAVANGEHPHYKYAPEMHFGQSHSINPNLQASTFFVYDHAIIMMEPATPALTNGMLCYYSSVVLFNWALTLHREGMLGRETYLKKAASVYVRCFQVLPAMKSSEQTSSILTLLVLNNLAQIHFELCEYSECSHCLKQVRSLLAVAGYMDCCVLTSKDSDELFLNTMLSPTAAQAA
jgi:hypothetical protein